MTAAQRGGATCPVGPYSWSSGDHPPMTGFQQFDGDRLPPVFFTKDAHGYYVFTDHDVIAEGYTRPDLFSSQAMEPIQPDPPYMWIPEMLDPPEHTKWRPAARPPVHPARAAAMKDGVRALAVDLIDHLASADYCDFVTEFANKFPTTIFLSLMGLPQSDLDAFLKWEHEASAPQRRDRPHPRKVRGGNGRNNKVLRRGHCERAQVRKRREVGHYQPGGALGDRWQADPRRRRTVTRHAYVAGRPEYRRFTVVLRFLYVGNET